MQDGGYLPTDGTRCSEATARGRGGGVRSPLGFLPTARGVRHERERQAKSRGTVEERRQRARL